MAKKESKRTSGKKAASKSAAKRPKRAPKKPVRSGNKPKTSTAKKVTKKVAKKSSAAKKTAQAAGAAAKKRATPGKAGPEPKSARRSQPARAKTSTRRAAPSGAGRSDGVPRAAAPVRPKSSARALTRKEMEEFRFMLVRKRAQLVGDVDTLRSEALRSSRREAAGDLSSCPVHMADLGTDNYEMEFTLGLIEGERAVLQEIDEALERIRDGTYGICLATGNPIGKARLRAKPWARYCYEHMLALEKGKQHGA